MDIVLFIRERKVLILGVFLTLIVIILASISALYLSKKTNTTALKENSLAPKSTPHLNNVVSSGSPPTLRFDTYQLMSAMPVPPPSLSLYYLKISFTPQEVEAFANKLGLTEKIPTTNKKIVAYINTSDPQKRGALMFNTNTGKFRYESYGVLEPRIVIGGNNNLNAQTFISELFPGDTTISCNDSYNKNGLDSSLKYVECHRDWQKVGNMPILNAVGVLNIPENVLLSSLELAKNNYNLPPDQTVVNSSDNSDSQIRPNDFNTVTLVIDPQTDRIISVDSNLRWIEKKELISPSQDLLTPQEAYNEFSSANADYSFFIPAGNGTVNLQSFTNTTLLHSRKAQITDYLLTYLEKPDTAIQRYLIPMYLIRGIATLDNGYTIRFVQTVPATRKKLSFISDSLGEIAGVSSSSDESDRGQKQGTFFFPTVTPTSLSFTPTPTPCPPGYILNEGSCILIKWGDTGTPVPSASPTSIPIPLPTATHTPIPTPPTVRDVCDASGLLTFNLPGIGKVGYDGVKTHVFYFIPAEGTTFNFEEVRPQFYALAEEQVTISFSKILKITNKLSDLNGKNSSDKEIASSLLEAMPKAQNNYPFTASLFTTALFPAIISGKPVDTDLPGVNTDIKPHLSSSFKKFTEALRSGQALQLAEKPDLFPGPSLSLFMGIFALSQSNNQACPYISGDSPFIFLYSEKNTKFSINLSGIPVTYEFPKLSPKNTWDGTVGPDRMSLDSVHNFSVNSLYYEYDREKVPLNGKNGKIVKNSLPDVDAYLTRLADELGLTAQETASLLIDIHQALFGIKSDYVSVSLVNEKEVNDRLPLVFSPQPDHLYRIQFVLNSASSFEYLKEKVAPPDTSLTPLQREGFTVVEIGAVSY